MKVVVVGGGLAGLTAAYRLHQRGIDVELYEARGRLGGRVLSVQVGEHVAELGAQNITDGGEAEHLYRLIEEFNLELLKSGIKLHHSYFDGKELIPESFLKIDPDTLKKQLNRSAESMKELLGALFDENDLGYKIAAVKLAAYEGAPLERLSPLYAETLYHMLLGGLSQAHQENVVQLVSIKGGNGRLIEKMAEALGPRVHLNAPLTKVSKNLALTFQDGRQVKADRLILAIPCSVYHDINFEGIIPAARLKGIQSVPYGANAKIIVPFADQPAARRVVLNEQMVCFYEPSRSCLTLYCLGERSRFTKETIGQVYREARPMVEKGFGDACPPFDVPLWVEENGVYEGPVGYSWPNDPYCKGSYSYIGVGQEALLTEMVEAGGEKFRALFAPIDQKVYFAGEHASILFDVPGTMEAACESGERVARAIRVT